MRRFLLTLGLLLALGLPREGLAQAVRSGSGTVQLTNWPGDASPDDEVSGVLPAIDTLALRYRYEAGRAAPRLSFVMSWQAGPYGSVGGERVPYAALPPDLRLTGVTLHADVLVRGVPVAETIIAVDSMALAAAPAAFAFEAADLSYGTVFLDTPPEEARRYFEEGFALQNLKVLRATFEAEEPLARGPRQRPVPRRTVYVLDPAVDVFVGWRIGPKPYRVGSDGRSVRGELSRQGTVGRDEDDRGRQGGAHPAAPAPPEEERTGRTEDRHAEHAGEGRSGRAERSTRPAEEEQEKEDDEENESLVEEALFAASMVGLVAYGGGTVGYYGTTATPLGLTAGWVGPEGGALLQAGVNAAVLGASEVPDRLTAAAFGFYDLFGAPLQPALGAGVVLTGREDVHVAPSLSLGAAGNFGRVVVLGGYDLLRGAVAFGVAFNFRHHRAEDRGPPVAER